MDARSQELSANLRAVRGRINLACQQAGRQPQEVTLVVVTKYFGAQDVRRLAALGVDDVGENKDQEAREKHAQCADVALRWHFVGQLQTNKASSVIAYADLVHTVDRVRLVRALDRAAQAAGRRQDVLVQVGLDDPPRPDRGGVLIADLPGLVAELAAADGLRVCGVMGVAPPGVDPAGAFAALAAARGQVQTVVPEADMMSAGMSGDLEAAIAAGATHLRIGTAVLGSRPDVRYGLSEGEKSHKGDAQ